MKAKIYTKTGDLGKTALVGGRRVSKSDLRLDAYGTVDELNSCIGIAATEVSPETVAILQKIQNALFNLGSRLACEDETMMAQLPTITDSHVRDLEEKMDAWEATLPALKNFILPGGCKGAAHLHLARTICRRAERLAVALNESTKIEPVLVIYLNRLSDFLFTLARKVNHDSQVADIAWQK